MMCVLNECLNDVVDVCVCGVCVVCGCVGVCDDVIVLCGDDVYFGVVM